MVKGVFIAYLLTSLLLSWYSLAALASTSAPPPVFHLRGNGVPEGGGHIVASLLTPERDQRRPTSPELPLDLRPMEFLTQPPSYDEVVGAGYKDAPPMYSEVVHTNTNH